MKYLDRQTGGRFRAMTGYDFCELTDLLSHFEPAHNEYLSRYHLNGKPHSGVRKYTININSVLPCGVRVIRPEKKPKGKELTKEQKERNREISSFRVRVEHAICSVKRYRIVKDECRLRKNNFVDEVFIYCAALHHFRLRTRPFAYKNNLI